METTSPLLGNACYAEGTESVEPHLLFLRLLETIGWDHTTLLDFIMSPETCFLLYLTRYLQYMLGNWNRWESACSRFHISDSSRKPHLLEEDLCGKPDNDLPGKTKKRKITSEHDDDGGMQPETARCRFAFVADSDIVVPAAVNADVLLEQRPEPTVHVFSDNSHVDYGQPVPRSGAAERSNSTLVDYSSSSDDGNALSDDGNGGSISEEGKSSVSQRNSSSSSADDYSNDANVLSECILDNAMSVLIRLRLAIERLVMKQLFPYNIRPLIRLLEQCEHRYDTL